MKTALLLSTVAAALAAHRRRRIRASDMKQGRSAGRAAPAAQQNAPAEKIAPTMKAGQHERADAKAPETTGQAPPDVRCRQGRRHRQESR